MLQINMADGVAVLHSLIPYLAIAAGLLLLALVVTVAVNKATVGNRPARKLIHSQAWLVALSSQMHPISDSRN